MVSEKSKLSRRRFLWNAATATLATSVNTTAHAQLTPFVLTLRRDRNLPTTLNLDDCIMGTLHHGGGSLSDPGAFLCDTLELPFRNELREISCIRSGSYSGFVRTEPTSQGGPLGWRIQLEGTKQLAIQMHVGNTIDDTRGCILVGTRETGGCVLRGGTSAPARDQVRALYGAGTQRPIRLVVLN